MFIFNEKYLTFNKIHLFAMKTKSICIQQKIFVSNENYFIFKKMYSYSITYLYLIENIHIQ